MEKRGSKGMFNRPERSKLYHTCEILFTGAIALVSVFFLVTSIIKYNDYKDSGAGYIEAKYVTGTMESFENSDRYRMLKDGKGKTYMFPSNLISIHTKNGDSVSLVLSSDG